MEKDITRTWRCFFIFIFKIPSFLSLWITVLKEIIGKNFILLIVILCPFHLLYFLSIFFPQELVIYWKTKFFIFIDQTTQKHLKYSFFYLMSKVLSKYFLFIIKYSTSKNGSIIDPAMSGWRGRSFLLYLQKCLPFVKSVYTENYIHFFSSFFYF